MLNIKIQKSALPKIEYQCSGSEINNFGSGSSNRKSGISDPDPSVTRDGEKRIVNFGDYEDTNGSKSLTF